MKEFLRSLAIYFVYFSFYVPRVWCSPESPKRAPVVSPELVFAASNDYGADRRLVVASISDVVDAKQALLLRNWALVTRAASVSCVVVVCGDDSSPAVGHMQADGACAVMRSEDEACALQPRLGRWSVVSTLLAWGFDVVCSDPDVAHVRTPLTYYAALIRAHPSVDVITMSDASTSSTTDVLPLHHDAAGATHWQTSFPRTMVNNTGFVTKQENQDSSILAILPSLLESNELGLENPANCQHQFNTGFMLWRSTPRASALLHVWNEHLKPLLRTFKADDQLPFYNLARIGSSHCATVRQRVPTQGSCDSWLNAVHHGTACLGIFNLPQFANGFVYQSQRAHEQYGIEPYVYHATYSGDKTASLTEEGFWFLNDHAQKFLVYEPVLETKLASNRTWEASWYLVRHQLRQLAVAAALAVQTGRTLVLPRFALSCHCFFYAIDVTTCMADGLRINLPYVAPQDHVLKPRKLDVAVKHVPHDYLVHAKPHEKREEGVVMTTLTAASHHRHAHVLRLVGDLSQFLPHVTVPHGFDDALGSWCCITTGKWPDDQTFKARYRLYGGPHLTLSTDKHSQHGTCGA